MDARAVAKVSGLATNSAMEMVSVVPSGLAMMWADFDAACVEEGVSTTLISIVSDMVFLPSMGVLSSLNHQVRVTAGGASNLLSVLA